MGFVHEHIVLPLSDFYKKEHTYRYLSEIRNCSGWDKEKVVQFQNEKLRDLLQYASQNVPFYVDLFSNEGLSLENFSSVEDIGLLPIVDKGLMRSMGMDKFSSATFPTKKRYYSRSSGSTGEPFSYYETKDSYSYNMATKLWTWYLSGYRIGDRYMKIANSPRRSWVKRLQDKVNNCIYIAFRSMSDEDLRNILNEIETKQPLFIRSYPAPLYLLAQYRLAKGGYSYSPKRIFTTGSTLTKEYRSVIESAFGCDVIDSYSCEGTPNTYETPAHDGYHVAWQYGIIEVLDENDKPLENGIGRVIATDLRNYAEPFIRYNTQDLVEVKDGVIIRIIGRECDSYVVSNNTRFTVHNFTTYFSCDVVGVTAYQIVRKKDSSVLFRLVVDEQYSEDIQKKIVHDWTNWFQTIVDVELVEDIPLMGNNKHLAIVEE